MKMQETIKAAYVRVIFLIVVFLLLIGQTMYSAPTKNSGFVQENELAASPDSASIVGSLGGEINHSVISGQYGFIAQGYQLVVLDLQGTAGDNVAAALDLGVSARTMTLSGNLLYHSAHTWSAHDELTIIDISDPLNPAIISRTTLPGIDNYIDKIIVVGGYAYLADGRGLNYIDEIIVVDISDSASPAVVAEHTLPAIDFTFSTMHGYLLEGSVSAPADNKLTVYDISDKASFQEEGSLDLPYAYRIAGGNSTVYVAHNRSSEGLKTVNVDNPQQPVVAGQFTSGDVFYGIGSVNSTVYVSSFTELHIVDASDRSNPAGRSETNLATGFSISHATTNALALHSQSTFFYADVSDPSNPVITEPYVAPGVIGGIDIGGDRLYCVDINKLWVYDLTDPADPQLAGTVDVSWGNKVFVDDGTAYVTDQGPSITVYDVSGGGTPVSIGTYTASSWVVNMGFRGNHAYVLTSVFQNAMQDQAMLEILDVSNPSSPSQAGSLLLEGDGIDLFVPEEGDLVYVAYQRDDATKGFQVIDVSTPSAPVSKSQTNVEHDPYTILVVDSTLFLGKNHDINFNSFIDVYDVSDPANPQFVHDYTLSTESRLTDMIYLDDFFVVSLASRGIYTYDYDSDTQTFIQVLMIDVPMPQMTVGYIPEALAKAASTLQEEKKYIYGLGGIGDIPKTDGNYGVKIIEMELCHEAILVLDVKSEMDLMICPPETHQRIDIGKFFLTAEQKIWQVNNVSFNTEGNGRVRELYSLSIGQQIQLHTNRGTKYGSVIYHSAENDSLVRLNFNIDETLLEGETLEMTVWYYLLFPSKSEAHFMPCPLDEVKKYAVSISMDQVSAVPLDPADKAIKVPVDETFTSPWTTIACVQNITQNTGFNMIDEAVNDEKTIQNDTCEVCAGIFTENVTIKKPYLTIRSKEGAEKTHVVSEILMLAVFYLKRYSYGVKLQGFFIQGSAGVTGVFIESDHCVIGVTENATLQQAVLMRNVISGCDYGIFIHGSLLSGEHPASNNKIMGNYIGTNLDGTKSMGNGVGVDIGGHLNTIGGSLPQLRNIISGNDTDGISLFLADNNKILGNYIGTKSSGNEALPNLRSGINFNSGHENRIGGILPEEGNVISGNGEDGVHIKNCDYGNWVVGNFIGWSASRKKIIPNENHGISVKKSSSAVVSRNIIFAKREGSSSEIKRAGIYLDESIKAKIIQNRVKKGHYGLYMNNSQNTGLMINNLKDNDIGFKPVNSTYFKLKGNAIDMSRGPATGIHITGTSGVIEGNRISDNTGSGIYLDEGSVVKVTQNNIYGNTEFGLDNSDPSVTIDASSNWWGNNAGPGSGDINGNVNAIPWLSEPVSLVAFALEDTVYMPEGVLDSTFYFYFQNLVNPDDSVNVSLTDTQGWLTGEIVYNVAFKDSVGGEALVHVSLPAEPPGGSFTEIRAEVVSLIDPSATASDSFLVMVYAPQLAHIWVLPDSAIISPGDTTQFSASGRDQHENAISFTPVWSATGGTIDTSGTYIAGEQEGTYSVTVADLSTQIQGEAVVIITTETGMKDRSRTIPQEFCLYQSFPNPFNPVTTIRFDVKEPVRVNLKIYDIIGREVATLIDSQYDQGRYTVRFDASLYATGLYFYKIQMGDYVAVKKMMLLK